MNCLKKRSLATSTLHSLETRHTSSSTTAAASAHAGWGLRAIESTSGLSLSLLTLGILDRLVNTEDGASSLSGGLQHVETHLLGFPHELLVEIVNLTFEHVDTHPHALLAVLGVSLAKLVEHIGAVHAGVLRERPGDGLESLGEVIDDELNLTVNTLKVFTQVAGELHLDGATTSNDGVGLVSSTHNHDSVVEGSLGLLEVLGSTTSEHESGRLGGRALGEHVVALVTKLDLLELAAKTEHILGNTLNGRLEDGTSGLTDTLEIVLGNATSTEDISVGEVLGGEITDGEAGEHNFGARLADLVKLVIDNVPLGIDNSLEVLGVINTHLSVILLGLELKLDVEDGNLGGDEAFGLLLETGVRESLLEADTVDEERVSDGATGDLLDTNVRLVEVLIEIEDGGHDELREELLILRDDLGVEGGLGALEQKVALLLLGLVGNLDRDLLDALVALLTGLTVALNDDLRVHTLFDEGLGLLEELTGDKHDGGGSITNLVVLRLGNIDESLGGGMHNVEKRDEGGTIVGDGNAATVVDQLIHTTGAEGRLDDVDDGLAGIDVRDDVALAFHLLSALLHNDDLRRQ